VRNRFLPFLILLAAAMVAAAPARADLVIFEDGRHLHVEGFDVQEDEERISLRLASGGSLVVPLSRVDRIVDDEIDHSPPPAAQPPVAVAATPRRSVRLSGAGGPLPGSAFDAHIRAAAREHNIDPSLIAAVIRAESGFDPRARSRKGARGLMQLMPATARRLGVRNAYDPRENIRGGARYLAELATRYGDDAVELIAAAYNAGENAVAEYGGIPPYRETMGYVKKVTAFWERALDAVKPAAVVAAAAEPRSDPAPERGSAP